ncbi:MAG: hypothetical protein Q9183_006049, partial [Haloplaca sp. 2 TL-2023]
MKASRMPFPREPLTLFHLPRELRNTIYHHYLFEPEGYHYHLESGKLRAKDNRSIDLNLMYTCSAIAAEMQHLPFQSNILHFSTSEHPSESERATAIRFDKIFKYVLQGKGMALDAIKYPPLAHYRTPAIDTELTLRYPQFAPLLRLPNNVRRYSYLSGSNGCPSSYGEPHSLFSAFQDYMIRLLSNDPDFRGDVVKFFGTEFASYQPGPFADPATALPMHGVAREDDRPGHEGERFKSYQQNGLEYASHIRSVLSMPHPEPWMIPSDDEMSQMNASIDDFGAYTHNWKDHPGGVVDRIRWRFSATAAAIRFLKSISQATRLGLKKIVLHENRISVARSESHALGLIPFCLDNPQLHIERRISVWGVLMSDQPSWSPQTGILRANALVDFSGMEENDMQ